MSIQILVDVYTLKLLTCRLDFSQKNEQIATGGVHLMAVKATGGRCPREPWECSQPFFHSNFLGALYPHLGSLHIDYSALHFGPYIPYTITSNCRNQGSKPIHKSRDTIVICTNERDEWNNQEFSKILVGWVLFNSRVRGFRSNWLL